MNSSTDSVRNFSINCRGRFKEYFLENTVISLLSTALNLGSCPVIILMNVLVIVAIKTRRRLQSTCNILLACLAVTDLAVGVVSQPLFIAQEIYFLSGASLVDYCYLFRLIVYVLLVPNIESLLILAILSTERYVAMKYSLRYNSIVTTPKLIRVVVCGWVISAIPLITSLIPGIRFAGLSALLAYITVIPPFLVIVFCHTKVYFISRRHMNQIKTEQLPSTTKAKFLKERKALKTTSIIIGFLFLSIMPSVLHGVIKITGVQPWNFYEKQLYWLPINFLCIFLNSLFNPLIYCWRNKDLRKVMMELINIRQNGN